MKSEPQREHRWLDKLLGDWTYETECIMGPDQVSMKTAGRETVRSLGGLWVICEAEGSLPDGAISQTVITLGYDPAKKRFLGTFVASMMSSLWVYDGALDESERLLTLDCEGPSFSGEGISKYQDIVECVSNDHRIMRSQLLGPDGKWIQFMVAHYRRKS